MRTKKLIEVFPDPFGFGIFHYLSEYNVPWDMAPEWLDLEYFGNRSGKKTISPLVETLLQGQTLTTTNLETLAGIIYIKYKTNWLRLWQAITSDYNPIENYNMIERETNSSEHSETASTSGESHVSGSDETQANNTKSVYGFNSVTSVKSDEDATRTTSDTESNSSSSGSSSNTGDASGERELTRSGNIGVTTSQMMIESEIELRKKNFYDMVYRDVDNILTIGVYCL